MSLISEALRKARQEAAEREAKERGMETPVVAGYWKRGGRLGVGLVLGAAIAMGAAVIGGGMMWWALADRTEPMAVDTSDGQAPAVREPVKTQLDQTVAELAPDQVEAATAPTETPVESKADEHGASPKTEGNVLTTVEVAESAPNSAEGAPIEAPSPEPQAILAEGEFVGEAQIGNVTLTLDYLVYRRENPFAQINGRDVRVGAVIEDYIVKKITENSVILTHGDTEIVLRVQ